MNKDKNILWISTGGTIACQPGEVQGLTPQDGVAPLKNMLNTIKLDFCNTEIVALCAIDSTEVNISLWEKLGDMINRAILSGKYNGIVITHGTDTMAYTAAVLECMFKNPPIPIVLTGSQLPFFERDSDAPGNLRNAFLTALSDINAVIIVFDGKIIPAEYSYKAYSHNKSGFISVKYYYGHINDKGIIQKDHIIQNKSDYIYNKINSKDNNIMLIKLTPYTDKSILNYALENKVRGVVVEAYGMGGIPAENGFLQQLASLADKGIKVDVISQCLFDGVDMNVYKVGKAALSAGITSSGALTAESAMAKMLFS